MPRTRANGEGMVRKRKDGSYEARFSFYDNNGKLISRSFYAKKRLDALGKMQSAQNFLKNGNLENKQKPLPLNNWIIFWLIIYVKNKVEFSTINSYASAFVNYIQDDIGKKDINKLTSIDLQVFINTVAEKTKRTADFVMLMLKKSYKKANELGYSKTNPTLSLEKTWKSNGRSKSRAINNEEEKQLIAAIDKLEDLVDKTLIYTFLSTGVSRSECLAIKWENVNLEKKTITIKESYKLGIDKNVIGETKNPYRVRTVLANDKLKNLLMQFPKKSGFVFKGKFDGKPLNLDYPYKKLQEVMPNITLLDLRHTFATRCMERNVPKLVTMRLMGHSSSKMLDKVYQHVNDDFLLSQFKQIEEMF